MNGAPSITAKIDAAGVATVTFETLDGCDCFAVEFSVDHGCDPYIDSIVALDDEVELEEFAHEIDKALAEAYRAWCAEQEDYS